MDSNYFTCTLGEAVEINTATKKNFKTIDELIEFQAIDRPHSWAVGFPNPNHGLHGLGADLFSFEQLRDGILYAARDLRPFVSSHSGASSGCVALLCHSSLDFLFAWLGLIRTGFSVLLLAPQCEPEAINHLCKSCEVHTLLHDKAYAEAAAAAVQISNGVFKASVLPWQVQGRTLQSHLKEESSSLSEELSSINASESDIAYIHHTSGTSGNLPKPIHQTHHAAVGVLPCLGGEAEASFTTTPLYHGGIADCFRAWTSGALIWLFPGADLPITSNNILLSIDAAQKAEKKHPDLPCIKYFSSVPYILQLLAEDASGLEALRKMNLVGVGGAALPQTIGDDLVKKGVHLISRFGSAECGFLLSSSRNCKRDQAWQYLRVPPSNKFLKFEEQTNATGLSELVVLKGWPHMAKTNREDGSFATCDLFEPHPTISGAWKYHSRSDSQITLITGKKFDPGPIEEELASSEYINEAMIFGNGKQQAGALIFPSRKKNISELELKKKVFEIIDEANSKGQPHTRISTSLIVMMKTDSGLLPRSSKGTILRGAAESTFGQYIEGTYEESTLTSAINCEFTENGQIKPLVQGIVNKVIGKPTKLDDNADFYANGVDSAMCTQIRSIIEVKVFQNQCPLPWNMVYDCGNIERLSNYILDRVRGNEFTHDIEREMLDLVEKYSTFKGHRPLAYRQRKSRSRVVVLTGATGALGTEILQALRSDCSVSKIICLVRTQDSETARSRVSKSLISRRKPPLLDGENVYCFFSQLHESSLGLPTERIEMLRRDVTYIIHAAWTVNFSLPLRSFEENIAGVENLINFANSCDSPAQMVFCSSTASILGPNHSMELKEEISTSPSDSDVLGYSRSKWVAEAICSAAANKRYTNSKIKILRIGQLTGDTQNGIWNMTEAWPLMLSTINILGYLPQLEETMSWLPLDIAAKGVVEISFYGEREADENDRCLVYHVYNNSTTPSWSNLLVWIGQEREQKFDIVEPKIWLEKLEELDNHPAKNLIGLWKKAFEKKPGISEMARIKFETKRAEATSKAMYTLEPVDEVLGKKIWRWIEEQTKHGK